MQGGHSSGGGVDNPYDTPHTSAACKPTSVILVSIFASVTFHEPRPAMPAKTIPKPAGAPSREDHRQQKKRERHARENRCAAGGFRPLPAVRVRPIPRTNVTLAERSMLITSGFRACDSSQFGAVAQHAQ